MGEKQKEHAIAENTTTEEKPSLKAASCYQSHFVIPYRHRKKLIKKLKSS